MPRYVVTLTDDEIQELKALVQKGGKGYRIRHAQILLKLDQRLENRNMIVSKMHTALLTVRLQALQNALLWKAWKLPSAEKSRKTAAVKQPEKWKPESAPLPVLPRLRVFPAEPCRQLLMN